MYRYYLHAINRFPEIVAAAAAMAMKTLIEAVKIARETMDRIRPGQIQE